MKKFAKLFVVALSVALVASMFALVPSAAEAEMIDPNTLVPASDRVVFIMDPERDPETHEIIGELPGDGTGSSAENPLEVVEHASYVPDAEYPKGYLMTSFYQATEFLKDTGGTIVICGPIYLGWDESYGSGNTTKDVFTADFKTNTIKFTSVYDGVDYRETNGAKIIIDTPAEIGVKGQSIWENLDIETMSTDRVISFNNNATLVGEGIKCYPSDLEIYEGIATNYISLSGGHRYSGGADLTTNLVVKSGTYNVICGGIWGVNNQRKLKDDGSLSWTNNLEGNSKAKLVIDGTTCVLGQVIATNRRGADFSGSAEVIINNGVFECDINGVGPTGFTNEDGNISITINGGDFKGAWSINDADASAKNNMPAYSVLDLSGWQGDKVDLAFAYALVTVFTDVKLPEGTTTDELTALYQEALETLESETEEDESAEPEGDETTEGPVAEDTTKAPVVEDTTKAPEDTTAPAPENGNDGDMTWIFIVVGVVVVAVVAVVVVVLMKKKAAK